MEDIITLKVYDDDDKVIKEVSANIINIKMGPIRKLMKLTGIEEVEDMGEMLRIVSNAWDSITKILDKVFPEMTEDDWDGVPVSDLLPIVIKIFKKSLTAINTIPQEKN